MHLFVFVFAALIVDVAYAQIGGDQVPLLQAPANRRVLPIYEKSKNWRGACSLENRCGVQDVVPTSLRVEIIEAKDELERGYRGGAGTALMFKVRYQNTEGETREGWIRSEWLRLHDRDEIVSCNIDNTYTTVDNQILPILQKVFDQNPPPPETKFEYEDCNSRNNYLERLFSGNGPQTLDERFPPECTFQALKANSIGNFLKCESSSSRSGRRTTARPCVSERLHKEVHNSLVEVAECTGIEVEAFFSLINLESSMQPSAVSETGALGMGQLTSGFTETRNNKLQYYMDEIFKKRPNCRSMVNKIESLGRLQNNGRCDKVAPPKAPYMNLVYSAMGLMDNKFGDLLGEYVTWSGLSGIAKSPRTLDLEANQRVVSQRIRELEVEAEGTNTSRLVEIREELRELRLQDSRLRLVLEASMKNDAMNRYESLNTDAKKILNEVSFYGYNNGTSIIGPQFRRFRLSNSFDEAGTFSNFTGPDGRWLRAFPKGNRNSVNHMTEQARDFVYNGEPGGRYDGNNIVNALERVEERAGVTCGIY